MAKARAGYRRGGAPAKVRPFWGAGDDRAMMKREMNIRDLPKPLQYAVVGVLLVFVVVTPLNWIVGLIFGTPLLEMLFGTGVNEAYRSISQFIYRATHVIEGKSQHLD